MSSRKFFDRLVKPFLYRGTPSQTAWGFALGSIPGLTPILSLHNLIVLILLLVLKVNLAAALLGLLLFSFIAPLLAPLFHSIGYWILVQIPALQPLWTSLYNAPVAPLSRFNNTVVMGSLIVSLVFLVPLFFLFRVLVRKYRKSRNSDAEKQRVSRLSNVRWKGLIPLVILIVLAAVISRFFMDKWIETGMEKASEAAVGAKVDVDGFHLDLLKMTMKWDRLQVADPRSTMQNIVETDRVAFRMNAAAMLRKRTVIEEMTLADLRTGTPRSSDGALPKKKEIRKDSRPGPFDKMKKLMVERIAQLPVLQFDPSSIRKKLNLDSLIAIAGLKMPARLDSSKQRVLAVSADWENFYKGFHPENDLEKIRNDFNAINPEKLKTVPELMSALDKVQGGQKTLKAIQDTVKTRRIRIQTDFDQLKGYAASLDGWYNEDFRSIMSLARLPDLSVKNIGMMLFGKSIMNEIDRILGMVQTVRGYMPRKSAKPEKEMPQRMKGQDILFPSRNAWPKFLIEKILVSGQTGGTDEVPGLLLAGEVSDVTSQPWVIGRPTKLSLNGKKGDGRSLSLTGNLDHTKDIESDQFHFQMDRISLNNFGLAESDYLPKTIQKGLADVNINTDFVGGRTDVRLAVAARGLDFDFPEQASANKFVDITRDVMRRMDLITLDTRLIEEGGKSDFKMDSNLDERISAELKAMGSQALAEAEGRIRGKLDGMVSGKRTELNGLYEQKRGLIEGKIKEYEKKADELRMAVDAKIEKIKADIEARKKQEEDKLKKGAKNLLDGVLKK